MIDHEVVVVGAGFGGIGAGIELQRKGIHDFVILDKWDEVGGTWHANTYPGVAVDIPSFIYSFSYEQRSSWSRLFAPGQELAQYARDLVTKYGLREKLRLSTTVTQAEFDEQRNRWLVRTDGGETIATRFLVAAVGGLERPKLPDIDGLDDFAGTLMHTAMWDHDVDLVGKRVGVIGTGATALQLVPEIAKQVGHLDVFQRTPIWVAPKVDARVGAIGRAILGNPALRSAIRTTGTVATEIGMGGMIVGPRWITELGRKAAERRLRGWMRSQVHDPDVREKLIPQYGFGCKRPSMSNTYLRTFNRDNVALVTEPIERITGTGVVTRDGRERELDVLICATGFKLWDRGAAPPFPTIGRDGVELGQFWFDNRYQAYQGVSVPGFPNLFSVIGPYGFVLGSYIWMIEATTAHLARAIAETKRRGATSCEIRQDVHDEYFEKCLRRNENSVLFTPTCQGSNTYYIDPNGDSPFRPSTHGEMYWQNRHYPLDVYTYGSETAPPGRRPRVSRRPAKEPA